MQLEVIDMLPILNIARLYLIGMMVYAMIRGSILFWGGWQYKKQNKRMYYGGLLSYSIVLFTIIKSIRVFEEAMRLQ
jgi:hypothetical protein